MRIQATTTIEELVHLVVVDRIDFFATNKETFLKFIQTNGTTDQVDTDAALEFIFHSFAIALARIRTKPTKLNPNLTAVDVVWTLVAVIGSYLAQAQLVPSHPQSSRQVLEAQVLRALTID